MPFPKPDDKNKLKTWGGGKDVRQARKGQGETNERMEYLIEQVERTNQLLEWLGTDVLPIRSKETR